MVPASRRATKRRSTAFDVAAVAVPLLLLAAVGWWMHASLLADARARTERNAEALAEHVRRTLEAQDTVLEAALARVRDLDRTRAGSEQRVQEFLRRMEHHAHATSAIIVLDPEGRLLASGSAAAPAGFDLSGRDYVRVHRERSQERAYVGEVVRGTVSGGIGFTVSRQDAANGNIAVTRVPLEPLQSLFARQGEGDRDAVTLAREDGAALVLLPAAADPVGYRLPENAVFRRYMRGEVHGTRVLRSGIDGIARVWTIRPVGSWPVHVLYGFDLGTVWRDWLLQLVPFALLTLLASGVLLRARVQAERAIAARVRAEAEADAMRMRAEQADRLAASEAHTRLLMREVNHRAKNMLGVVQAMVRITAREGEPGAFVVRIGERIRALSASQDLLVHNSWAGVSLEQLVRSQLAHLGDHMGTRVSVAGPGLEVSAQAAQAIGMALHELATNATKYGALSNDGGRVDISWTVAGDRLEMRWEEHGGPPVEPPSRRGFGTTVVEAMASAATGGEARLHWCPDGVVWVLTGSVGHLAAPHASPDGDGETSRSCGDDHCRGAIDSEVSRGAGPARMA